jgi:hypothetical protein
LNLSGFFLGALPIHRDHRHAHSVLQLLGSSHPDNRWIYTPERTWIERRDGSIIAEREKPRGAFADHIRSTKWDDLHLTYFLGYAMWTYLTVPFLLHHAWFRDSGAGAS